MTLDPSHISIVATSLGIARDMAKGLLGIRDFNLVAEKVSALNEQLLKAQEALLSHNAGMFELQQQNFEAREELRKLKEAATERGRYSLVEIAPGNFAYRVNLAPQEGGAGQPGSAEPLHYLCQPCFDGGAKVVLGKVGGGYVDTVQQCPICKRGILMRKGDPLPTGGYARF